jgi:D-serine deaminase-like pyridoxal phosphate-dependent protein
LQITALNSAAESAGVVLDVLVEIDVGAGRCGVRPMEPALELARQIASSPALRFSGLQAYHGKAQHMRDPDERRQAIEGAANLAMTTVELLRQNNIASPKVTGAGTGTFEYEATSGVYGELQAGSYVFLDADYALNQNEERSLVNSFTHSLFVYATIMSQPVPDRTVLDAGLKAVSVDSGMPTLPDHPGVEFVKAADEHGVLTHFNADPVPFSLGDKIRLVPGHCDPTVNLHDWFVCYRGERVESLWPITARGALL